MAWSGFIAEEKAGKGCLERTDCECGFEAGGAVRSKNLNGLEKPS